MRLSSKARSILTEAKRFVDAGGVAQEVKFIVLQPGEELPNPPTENGVIPFIIRLSPSDTSVTP